MCTDGAFVTLCGLLVTYCVISRYACVSIEEVDDVNVVYMSISRPAKPFAASILLQYSFPLVYIDAEYGVYSAYNTTHDDNDDEIVFLRSHEKHLDDIRMLLDDYNGMLAIRYECRYKEAVTGCSIMYVKDSVPVISATYFHGSNYMHRGIQIDFITGEGEMILNALYREPERHRLIRNYAAIYSIWRTVHYSLLERTHPDAFNVTVFVSDNQKFVTCKAITSVPTMFYITLRAPDTRPSSSKGSFDKLLYVAETSVNVSFSDTIRVTCEVYSTVGWVALFANDIHKPSDHSAKVSVKPLGYIMLNSTNTSKDTRSESILVHKVYLLFILMFVGLLTILFILLYRKLKSSCFLKKRQTWTEEEKQKIV
nr:membrane protein b150 [Mastomys natalensis cytomegalovirus 3]WEG69966.1 membrane protein b150 [Mastomys natalensis cytomegalovirus 3]WEG70106.1 membrane protein b150 [Mastomys natalensis cytomegalovirus 3]WEG70246.1 membrane protein b150 [Mastomys natalensis cytomegalovirus 3]WEG70386.1 membrane protein b150 [Mastomys natalensis cytomegalovirus 3]